jgi:hypothetical protein
VLAVCARAIAIAVLALELVALAELGADLLAAQPQP